MTHAHISLLHLTIQSSDHFESTSSTLKKKTTSNVHINTRKLDRSPDQYARKTLHELRLGIITVSRKNGEISEPERFHLLIVFLRQSASTRGSKKSSSCAYHTQPIQAMPHQNDLLENEGNYRQSHRLEQSRSSSNPDISRRTFLVEQRGDERRKSLRSKHQSSKRRSTLVRNGFGELYECSDSIGLRHQSQLGVMT